MVLELYIGPTFPANSEILKLHWKIMTIQRNKQGCSLGGWPGGSLDTLYSHYVAPSYKIDLDRSSARLKI